MLRRPRNDAQTAALRATFLDAGFQQQMRALAAVRCDPFRSHATGDARERRLALTAIQRRWSVDAVAALTVRERAQVGNDFVTKAGARFDRAPREVWRDDDATFVRGGQADERVVHARRLL